MSLSPSLSILPPNHSSTFTQISNGEINNPPSPPSRLRLRLSSVRSDRKKSRRPDAGEERRTEQGGTRSRKVLRAGVQPLDAAKGRQRQRRRREASRLLSSVGGTDPGGFRVQVLPENRRRTPRRRAAQHVRSGGGGEAVDALQRVTQFCAVHTSHLHQVKI